jgi:hypothetical protein
MTPRRQALAAAIACALTTAAVASAQPGHQVVTGTICRIDTQAGTFELLTGIGHSFRMSKVRFAADLKVMLGKKPAPVTALVPGTVCRVVCNEAEAGTTATAVEVMSSEPRGNP